MEYFEICRCDHDDENENDDLMCTGAFGSCEEKDDENEDLICSGASHSSVGSNTVSSSPITTPIVPSTPANDKSVAYCDSQSTSSQPPRSAGYGIEKYLVPHQCPTCLSYFSRDEIATHADACAENWFDTVGECPVSENLSEEQNVENYDSDGLEQIDHFENIIPERSEAMKRIVQTLKGNVKNTSINRVAIRRRCAFEDYMDARRKKFFNPEGLLKVCFTGEPAINGGGPRREFFTGTH